MKKGKIFIFKNIVALKCCNSNTPASKRRAAASKRAEPSPSFVEGAILRQVKQKSLKCICVCS